MNCNNSSKMKTDHIDTGKINIESSWKEVLKEEFQKPYFSELKARLVLDKKEGKTIYPQGPLIFRAFDAVPFQKVKAVIIGQDPYHNPGEAMGLCFSVPQGVKVPPSLKRIYKEMHEDIGIEIPHHGDLSAWTSQGVLLLNAMLTVEKNKAGAHRKYGWQEFTDAVIQKLSEEREHLVFFLWGNFAKGKADLIDATKHLILKSAHPSPLAGSAFFGNKHFSRCQAYLEENKVGKINWCL